MDQTYCVPGHRIHDNVSVIRDFIDVCDISHDGVRLVFLDRRRVLMMFLMNTCPKFKTIWFWIFYFVMCIFMLFIYIYSTQY